MLWSRFKSGVHRRLVGAAQHGALEALDTSPAYRRLSRQVEGLQASLDEFRRRFDETEHRLRRDIDYAGQLASAQEASSFVLEHMPNGRRFPHKFDTLRYGLDIAPPEGLTLEFGVAAGHTLRIITEKRPSGTVYGFDSYKGFPEDWRTDFPKGAFAMEKPDIPGAEIVEGWFEDTLPRFLADHDEPIAFVHADADLYSSTKTILDNLEPRLRPGTIIQFDEFFNYPGWRDHEFRAWDEFVARTGLNFRYEAYSADDEQVVVRVLP